VRELRASKAAKEAEVNVAPADGVLVVEDLPDVPKRDNPKKWNKRPPFWESIVEYYHESSNNIDEVLNLYENEFEGLPIDALSGDVNELVEEIDDAEIVDDDDDDENSDDEVDGDN